MTESIIPLPDYRSQSPQVASRFQKLLARPVVLRVEDVSKIFPSPDGDVAALEAINFSVHRRELMCIIGQSGCGKSTLVRILAGLESPSSGAVLLDEKPVTRPGAERGMVFQAYTLFPWLTVKDNVMFGLKMTGRTGVSVEQEARQWIAMVGLSKFEKSYPHQLSGGMKQRVAIARALANQPRVLLMDEPFGALDAQTRCQMQSYLLQIWKNVDVTIIFITHDLEEAIYLADRVLVLKAHPGRIDELIEVPVPRPRSTEQLITPEFLAMKKRLEELIHPPVETAEDRLPTLRMTMAGDEVE
jgi:NitT/TauT family transport system ATP-binding protein